MKKIILIDDNRDILAMWKMFLERQDYSPVTLESAKEFISYIDKPGLAGVGCIICDESLKDGLGSKLFEKMLELEITIPFIIVSGYAEEEILAKVSSPEKLKVLKKPISLMDLKQVIEASFDESSSSSLGPGL